GGSHRTPDSAIALGLRMFYAGADIIDVGGESTRSGAEPVSPEEEQRRVLPVIAALVKAGALVSIDTMHTATAAAAVEAGAAIINDVSGLT
ncbi:dihydropteroate synthase, partial [Chryseobacterium sp. SIMBA_028]